MLTDADLASLRAIIAEEIAKALSSVPIVEPRAYASPAKASKRRERFILPEWLHPCRDVWDAWVEARTRAKHPPTDWAKWLAVARLEQHEQAGYSVRLLLSDAAYHNWQDFYPSDKHRKPNGGGGVHVAV